MPQKRPENTQPDSEKIRRDGKPSDVTGGEAFFIQQETVSARSL